VKRAVYAVFTLAILSRMPMATHLSQKRVHDSAPIPDRLYFKIGDVARILDVETYVLRFWETQFPQLKPNKSGTGQRLYRRRFPERARLWIRRSVHGAIYKKHILSKLRATLSRACRWPGLKQRLARMQWSARWDMPAPSCERLLRCWLHRTRAHHAADRVSAVSKIAKTRFSRPEKRVRSSKFTVHSYVSKQRELEM